MIERLMNLERPYGEPEYSRLVEKIAQIKQQLSMQLNQDGIHCLEQLADLYMRQETTILRDTFADGFWAAAELMLELQQRRR